MNDLGVPLPNERQTELATFVAVFDPQNAPEVSVTAQIVRDLEAKLNQEVRGGDGVSQRGPGQIVSVPRSQLDLLMEKERIEVRQRYYGKSPEDFSKMTDLLMSVLETMEIDPGEFSWVKFGFNYIQSVTTDSAAVERLALNLFSGDFSRAVEYPIVGAAVWTWLELPDSVLWLRLEPYRSDPKANRVTVTANFLIEKPTQLTLKKTEIEGKLIGYSTELDKLLGRIGL